MKLANTRANTPTRTAPIRPPAKPAFSSRATSRRLRSYTHYTATGSSSFGRHWSTLVPSIGTGVALDDNAHDAHTKCLSCASCLSLRGTGTRLVSR
eukprot:4875277-Prymnesium_polylepis.1